MDLSFLIPSKIRRKVLFYYLDNLQAQPGIRELARELKESPQQVYRELNNMEDWGFLYSIKRGNQRVYCVNSKFVYLDFLKKMSEIQEKLNKRKIEVIGIIDEKKEKNRIKKIPIPDYLIPELTKKRTKPRAFVEEKFLNKNSAIKHTEISQSLLKLASLGFETYVSHLYRDGRITLRQASQLLKMPLPEVILLMKDLGVSGNIKSKEVLASIKKIII